MTKQCRKKQVGKVLGGQVPQALVPREPYQAEPGMKHEKCYKKNIR